MNKEVIEDFITSGANDLKFDHILSVDTVTKIMSELFFDKKGRGTSIGYEVNFYYPYSHNEYGTYIYYGSLHNGNYGLRKDDDNDEDEDDDNDEDEDYDYLKT
jgi:hypothetical protein